MKTMKLKNAITEMKNLLNGLRRVEMTEDGICGLKDRATEFTDLNNREEIDGNKMNSFRDLWDNSKRSKIHIGV